MTKLERVLLVLLILAVALDVVLLVTDDEETPRTQSRVVETIGTEEAGTREQSDSRAPPTEPPAGAEAPGEEDGPPPCRAIEIPQRPPESVTCRTASATLTIVDQADPLLLGDTHVRVLSAYGAGDELMVRVRVRNETDAEQGVQAGGQELYLNLNGIRVDPEPVREVRVPPHTGETVDIDFRLTPGQARVLNAQGRRAELGVRPWTSGNPASDVGVIRFFARPGEPPPPAGG